MNVTYCDIVICEASQYAGVLAIVVVAVIAIGMLRLYPKRGHNDAYTKTIKNDTKSGNQYQNSQKTI